MKAEVPPRTYNILFCGIGGQGVLKAAEICGLAALLEGYRVKKAEVHGMSQRGGSVEAHLRFGPQVASPLIARGAADLMVCFDAAEGEKLRDFLAPQGVDFAAYLPTARRAVTDPRLMNTYLLGVLSRHLPLRREAWHTALKTSFHRLLAENLAAFDAGAQAPAPGAG